MRISRSLLILPVAALSCNLHGQATATGNIVGVVNDATGAAVAGATVTATNKGTSAPPRPIAQVSTASI